MLTALGHALSGLTDGLARMDRAAAGVARDGAAEPRHFVDLLQARHQVAANAAVVRTEDAMVGTLLDVLA